MVKQQTAKQTTKTTTQTPATMPDSDVPEYLRQGSGRGNEGVGLQDLVIPRIDVVQSLSPVRKKSDPAYIDGAEEGMLFNSVSRELYGEVVEVIPVIYRREFVVWRDRTVGGGFRGTFTNAREAEARKQEVNDAGEGPCDVIEAGQHIVLVLPDLGEAAIAMAKSKMKVSRQWNSVIRMGGGDRFSRVYAITTVVEKGTKGEYHNLAIKPLRFVSKEEFKKAETLYDSIVSGARKVTVEMGGSADGDDGRGPSTNGDTDF